jgi:hypothetical protein
MRLIDDVIEAKDGTMIKIKRAILCDHSHPDAYDPIKSVPHIIDEYHTLDVIASNRKHVEVIGSNPHYVGRRIPVAARVRATHSRTDADTTPNTEAQDTSSPEERDTEMSTAIATDPSVNGAVSRSRIVSANFEEPVKKQGRKYSQAEAEPTEIRYYKDKVVTVVQLKKNIDKNKHYMTIDPGNGEDIDVLLTEANFNQLRPVYVTARDADKEQNGEYAEGERFGLAVKVVQGQGRAMKFRSATETENGSVQTASTDKVEVV